MGMNLGYVMASEILVFKRAPLMLSIIIVTMGDSDLLKSCVSSIREHVGLPHEIILVNNSSQELEWPAGDSLQCLENGRNMGFARAVNRGIRIAKGDKILLLNPDARFISDITTEMAAFLDSHERAGIVGPQLVFPDGSLQNSIDIIPNLATELFNKSLLKILFPRAYPSKRSRFTVPVQVPSVIGACMMMKRGLIDVIGPLDEGFFLYLEETDFCKRTNDAGFEVWHLPYLKIVHHQGASARHFDIRRKIEYQRSMYRFFRKHKGAFQGFALYLFSLAKLFIEMGGSAPSSVSAKGRHRMKKLFMVLIWHLMGMPPPWGLEEILPSYRRVRKNGYTWFIPQGSAIPDQAAEPRHFMKAFGNTVLNRSKTTFVKSGMLGERQIFLKRYNFKGLKDTIKNLFRKSRARRSFEAALMLGQAGIPTPPAVFACEKRICGILLESYIATEKIDALDLVKYVATYGYDTGLILSVAGLIRRLHEMGFIPVDLKGENLLAGNGRISIIDLDRLRRVAFTEMKTMAKNLSYLNASFCNAIPHEERSLFLEEYTKGNPLLLGRKRELAGRIKELTLKRLKERY